MAIVTKLTALTSLQKIILLLTMALLANVANAVTPIPDIAQTPLELTPTVSANVMILFDDSGSMDFEIITSDAISSGLFNAPHPDGSNFGSTNPALQINHRTGCQLISAAFGGYAYGFAAPTNHYVDSTGNNCYVAATNAWRFRTAAFNKLYFDPNEDYEPWTGFRPNGSGGSEQFPEIDITNAPLDPFNPAAGTIDLTAADPIVGFPRYFLWTDNNSDGLFQEGEQIGPFLIKDQPTAIQNNFANWFSYYRSRHLRAKALLGKLITSQTGTQIGLVRFNFSSLPSLTAEEMNADAEVDEKRALLDALYSTTPQQLAGLFEERSPLHKRHIETARYLQCTTSDVFSGTPECPAAAVPGGNCQANHIVVASDGFVDRFPFFFGGDDEGVDADEDADSFNDFDGAMHEDPSGNFFFSFLRTFSDVAIKFYKEDLRTSVANEVPSKVADRQRYPSTPELEPEDTLHQHVKTHVASFLPPFSSAAPYPITNLPPATPPPTSSFPWQDPLSSDFGLLQDLVRAAYSGRGEYIDSTESSATNELENLSQTIATGLGSTTPVAINTQSSAENAVIYRTFYDASSNSGDLVAQALNPDGTPNEDTDGNPIFIWSAAEELDNVASASSDTRTIITYSDNSGVGEGLRFTYDAGSGIDVMQQMLLDAPQPGSVMGTVGEDRLNYLRGQTENEGLNFDDGEFRIRPETESTGGGVVHFAKLGTIANAAPVFVGIPQAFGRFGGAWPSADGETYFDFQTAQADRDPTVLIAANDGMFHMFNAANGDERFAYVPELIFDQLSKLTDPEYNHQFYVDSTPSVNDAYVKASSAALNPSWNTIVVGGLGAGGRGYYAINITDPANFNDQDNARAQVMWEFGPEDDPDAAGAASDLGFSFGRPLIAMSNAADGSGNQRWVAVFGNGYNSTSANGNAIIYLLFIDEGLDGIWNPTDLIKIDTGIGGAVGGFVNPNGIADVRAIDTDGNGTIDRLYAGDLRGNLHVVDISSTSSSDWNNSSNRFILFNAQYQPPGDTQPITTRPLAVRHPTGTGFIVIFTSGSYFTDSDAKNTDIQSIYGVWDDLSGNQVDAADLVEQTLSNQTTAGGLEVRTVSDNPVTWGTPGGSNAARGWFIDFDVPPEGGGGVQFPGERAVRELTLQNGILFVNTIIPQESNCDPAPGGFGLGLDPLTGSDGNVIIFDINIDNIFDTNDNINVAGDSKIIVGTRFKSTPTDSSFFNNYRIVQLIDGDIDTIGINPGNNEFIGRQAWREVELQ